MKNLRALYNKCVVELVGINIDISSKIVRVSTNGRLRSTLGQCCFDRRTGNYTIFINPALLADEVDDMEVKDTIIHELLHTCPGSFNHGHEWKYRADIVNRELGYHVSRLATRQDMEAANVKLKTEEYKYALECKNCSKQYKRKRWSYALENPSAYRCGSCGGDLRTIGLNGNRVYDYQGWYQAANRSE